MYTWARRAQTGEARSGLETMDTSSTWCVCVCFSGGSGKVILFKSPHRKIPVRAQAEPFTHAPGVNWVKLTWQKPLAMWEKSRCSLLQGWIQSAIASACSQFRQPLHRRNHPCLDVPQNVQMLIDQFARKPQKSKRTNVPVRFGGEMGRKTSPAGGRRTADRNKLPPAKDAEQQAAKTVHPNLRLDLASAIALWAQDNVQGRQCRRVETQRGLA